jgi:hypothetical protein
MESISEQIRRRLRAGETERDLIRDGYKRTTVYSVSRKLKVESRADSTDQSLDRDAYLAYLMEHVLTLAIGDSDCDLLDTRRSMIEHAAEQFEDDTGRKPPEDLLQMIRQ